MVEGRSLQAETAEAYCEVFRQQRDYYFEYEPENAAIGHFAQALLENIERPEVRQLLNLVERRPEVDKPHGFNLLYRSFVRPALELDHEHFPQDYDSAADFTSLIDTVLNDKSYLHRVRYNLKRRHVQSMVSDRYASVILMATLTRERGDTRSLLDIGTSRGHGARRLALNKHIPGLEFDMFELFVKDKDDSLRFDGRLTRLAQMIMEHQTEVDFDEVWGIDTTNTDYESTKNWIRDCSLKPAELVDFKYVNNYDMLDTVDKDHRVVKIHQGDFSDDGHLNGFKKRSKRRYFDFVVLSTVRYQNPPFKQAKIDINAINTVSETGMVLTQDAPDGNFAKPYNYVLEVRDNLSDMQTNTVLRFENGRCRRAVLEAGRFMLNGTLVTMTEAIEQRAEELGID